MNTYNVEGQYYKVQDEDENDFKIKFPNAVLASVGTKQSKQEENEITVGDFALDVITSIPQAGLKAIGGIANYMEALERTAVDVMYKDLSPMAKAEKIKELEASGESFLTKGDDNLFSNAGAYFDQFDVAAEASITEDLANGNYARGGARAVIAGVESWPSLVAAFMGPPAIIALGVSYAGNKFEEEYERNPKASTAQLLLNATGTGAIEAGFEMATRGIFKYANIIGSKVGEEAAKEVLKGGFMQLGKNLGIAVGGEGLSEAATELTNMVWDSQTIEGREMPSTSQMMYRMSDAFIVGGLVGGTIGGFSELGKRSQTAKNRATITLMPLEEKEQYNESVKKIKDLYVERRQSKEDSKTRQIIDTQIQKEVTNIERIKSKTQVSLENLNSKDIKQYTENVVEINELNAELKDNINNENVSKVLKENIEALNQSNNNLLEESAIDLGNKITKNVKDQIKESNMNGKVTELTSDEISKLEIEDSEGNSLSEDASGQYGFISQESDGSFEIFLNKDKPMIGTAAHEFLHAVLFKTLKMNSATQTSVGDALVDYVSNIGGETSVLGARLAAYGKWQSDGTFKRNKNFGEETITIMSESIVDGSLKFNESLFTKVGDAVRRFAQEYLGREIVFNDGKDVYNFIKDYSKSIKDGKINPAILKVAKEGAKGKLIGDNVKAPKGKSISDSKVYQEVEAMKNDITSEDSRIKQSAIFMAANTLENEVDRRLPELQNISSEERADIVRDFMFNPNRGLVGMLNKYDPEINNSIMGYLNGFVPGTKMSLFDARLQEFYQNDPRFGNIIQSMQQEGVSERVEKEAAEKKENKTKEKPKKKKIVLADRLRIENNVDDAVAKKFSKLDLENLDFKTLKDLTPEITGELFGISPKKLISLANITKPELQKAQIYINKNADVLTAMLPEGATTSGTSTGIPPSLLKAFYIKTDRAKAAKTGSTSGLPIQIKNKNITRKQFLETFGIIDGVPVRTDRNTSARVLALANITGKMMTNQAVRKILIADESSPAHSLAVLEDGKSEIMFAREVKSTTKQLRIMNKKAVDFGVDPSLNIGKILKKSTGLEPIDLKTPGDENGLGGRKEYIQKVYPVLGRFLPESFFMHMGTFTGTTSKIIDMSEGIAQEKRIVSKNMVYVNVFEAKKAVKAAKKTYGPEVFTKPDIDIENAVKRVSYAKMAKMLLKGEFEAFNKSKARGMKKIFKAFEAAIDSDPIDAPRLIAAMLSSTSSQQGHFMRTMSIIRFVNTLGLANVEEHTDPATYFGNYLFTRLLQGNLFDSKTNYYDNATKSYFQGSLPDVYDKKLKGIGVDGEVYNYTAALPIDFALDILLGNVSVWIRYFNPNVNNNSGGIDPNVIQLNDGKTLAQTFEVDVPKKDQTPFMIQQQQRVLFELFSNKITQAQATAQIKQLNKVKIQKDVRVIELFSKAVNNSRIIKEPKGITILDFDDTLATSKSLIRFTTKDGTKGTLTPEQYASTYEDLQDLGYKFDFSEFNEVIDGKIAPLFNKAKKLESKFSTKDMFILTARPAEAAPAIQAFLKAQGLDIPIENITGLANSTSEAKALWVAEKVGEGYNDFYFADDALQNVQAVENMLNQFDVKRKVQQAKIQFSKDLNKDFNNILENVTGIESKKQFAATKARKRGADKGKFRLFIPPSHEDFVGLLYNFMGKGVEGNKHRNFLEQALVRPLNRAYKEIDTAKQAVANDYKTLNKEMPGVNKKLTKKTPDGDFTYQDAIRVYLWDKHGYKIPGLSDIDQANLVELVNKNSDLQAYAETLNTISKQKKYVDPGQNWETGNIRIDLVDATGRVGRVDYFAEFQQNADIIFSVENLNKIEAAYGSSFRNALEDMLYRIKTGINRPKGESAKPNMFMNWLNASVAGVMFFNTRSALLQQMSNVNYLNFADNNIFAAGLAFANQPQYWKDFAMIFNSDMLKQRRGGLQTDINGAELAEAIKKARPGNLFDQVAIITGKALRLGFLPTQIGDNIAIATGGAAFYRNRVNKYIKDGLSKKEAETKAFTDFQNITQSTQQSARPDMTSAQQSSWIGKIVLNFLNTPSQYNRIIKKAGSDLINRRITPPNITQMQSDMSNVSRILYYGAAQNLIFYSLQTALFAVMFGSGDEDEDKRAEQFLKKKERVINGSIDTILRGSGIYGVGVSTLKNMAIKFMEQREKGYNKDESAVIMEMLNFSPVVGIKARRIVNAEKTLNYNTKIIKEMETFDLDNPVWSAVTNYTQTITTAPANKIYQKAINLRNAADNDYTTFQRLMFLSGYTTWSLNLGDTKKMEQIKEDVKNKKKNKTKTIDSSGKKTIKKRIIKKRS